jgi:hypothetical protein
MPKNIILLSDGTGNSNIKNRGTNVYKLYEAINFNLPDCQQVAFYDDGVGTQEFKPLKILGGAFGWGLSRNIRELYKNLVQVYEPGDKIYLFGFSRGAFTVRRLAGLIGYKGILDKTAYPDEEQLENAVWHYFKDYRSQSQALLEPYYEPIIRKVFEERIYKLDDNNLKFCGSATRIEFMGVWDTVAAVGLPFDGISTNFLDKVIFKYKFKDHTLNQKVNKACHALSIDDERQSFSPLLWEDDPRIEQVWFPGVHANVGGGYPQQGLSLVVLEWMMEKVKAKPEGKKGSEGIRFVKNDEQFVKDRKYVFDKVYESRSGLGVYYRFKPRNIAKICEGNRINTPKIHISVFERIAQGVSDYAPGNMPCCFEVVDNQGLYKNSDRIVETVNGVIDKNHTSELLCLDSSHVAARRVLYYALLLYSLFTLKWLVQDDLENPDVGYFGTFKILVSPDGLLDKLAMLIWDYPVFLLVGIIIFIGSIYARKRMENKFTRFWSALRPSLRKLLKNE